MQPFCRGGDAMWRGKGQREKALGFKIFSKKNNFSDFIKFCGNKI